MQPGWLYNPDGLFVFYAQENLAYAYECSIEEMSAGYADTLMACRTVWAFPGIVVLGIAASIGIANLTAKLFK